MLQRTPTLDGAVSTNGEVHQVDLDELIADVRLGEAPWVGDDLRRAQRLHTARARLRRSQTLLLDLATDPAVSSANMRRLRQSLALLSTMLDLLSEVRL